MNPYTELFKTWRNTELYDFRSISKETFMNANVCGDDSEIIFPYGLNQQSPDSFKTWNTNNKKIYIYHKSNLKEDYQKKHGKEYKMPFFNQQNFEDKSYIIITEGEWDCLSWIEAGYSNAVSIPTGSGSAKSTIENEFEYINQFKEIYISFDNDIAGKKALEEVKVSIPKHKLRIINIDIEGFKDANDLLKDGFDLKSFFDNSEKPRSLNVISLSEIPFDDICQATPKGLTTGFISIDEILGGIRPGELTVISGDSGVGKTSLACNIALNFCECTGNKAWISSQEMEYKKLAEKVLSTHIEYPIRSQSATPKAKREKAIMFQNSDKFYLDPKGCDMTLDSIINGLTYAKYVNNIKLAIIEDLGSLASTLKGKTIENYDTVMRELHSKAMETGIHIFLIVHPTQTFDDRGVMGMANLKGSSSIKQTANNVLIIQRCDRAYPDNYLLKDKVTVRIAKNRALGQEGLAILKYHSYYDGYSDSTLSLTEFYELTKGSSSKIKKKIM